MVVVGRDLKVARLTQLVWYVVSVILLCMFLVRRDMSKTDMIDTSLSFVSSLIMQDDYRKGCTCPPGFRGDGVKSCEGINLVVL